MSPDRPTDVVHDLAWLAEAGFLVCIKSSPTWDTDSSLELILSNPYMDEKPDDWRGDDLVTLAARARAWAQVRGHAPRRS